MGSPATLRELLARLGTECEALIDENARLLAATDPGVASTSQVKLAIADGPALKPDAGADVPQERVPLTAKEIAVPSFGPRNGSDSAAESHAAPPPRFSSTALGKVGASRLAGPALRTSGFASRISEEDSDEEGLATHLPETHRTSMAFKCSRKSSSPRSGRFSTDQCTTVSSGMTSTPTAGWLGRITARLGRSHFVKRNPGGVGIDSVSTSPSMSDERYAIRKLTTRTPKDVLTRTTSTASASSHSLKVTRFLINPETSLFLSRWDVVVVVALIFVAICAPVQVAILQTTVRLDVMFVLGCVVDLIFTIDMILQFFVMYYQTTEAGVLLQHSRRKIACHYLKTWFFIDLVSIIPMDLIAMVTAAESFKRLKIVKIIRLLRLLKLARMLRAVRVFQHFELRMSVTYGKLALLKFFCILFIITHWLANLWALTLVVVEDDGVTPRWIDKFNEMERDLPYKTKDSPFRLYLTCLYFTSYTITSVGYGDIGPANLFELIVAIVMIVASGISWAIVLGQVCGIVTNLGIEEQEFRTMMDELNHMMEDRVMPAQMRQRLRAYFLSSKAVQRRARHHRIISVMSPGLQGEVVMLMNRRWIEKVSLLKQILQVAMSRSKRAPIFTAFVVSVSLKMQVAAHAKNEVFGDPHVLYILLRGIVGRLGMIAKTGSVWGTDFILSDSSIAEPPESCAFTYSEVMLLTRDNFLMCVNKFVDRTRELHRVIRYHTIWTAFRRYAIKEARRRIRARKEASLHGGSMEGLGTETLNAMELGPLGSRASGFWAMSAP